VVHCGFHKTLTNALSAHSLIRYNIFNPRAPSRWNIKDDQGEHPHDLLLIINGAHQVQALLVKKLLNLLHGQGLRRGRQLRKQTVESLVNLIVRRIGKRIQDLDTHGCSLFGA